MTFLIHMLISSRTFIIRYLRKGGIIAYPTESCYGLGALPTHQKALSKIIRLKKRPQHKGLIVIGDTLKQLEMLLQPLNVSTYLYLKQIWPAPKTYILPASKHISPLLRGKRRNQLAVRIPEHQLARNICRNIGSALVSTSCNRAGRRPCKNAREAQRQFGRQVKVIQGRIGKRKQPSQIIDWHTQTYLR